MRLCRWCISDECQWFVHLGDCVIFSYTYICNTTYAACMSNKTLLNVYLSHPRSPRAFGIRYWCCICFNTWHSTLVFSVGLNLHQLNFASILYYCITSHDYHRLLFWSRVTSTVLTRESAQMQKPLAQTELLCSSFYWMPFWCKVVKMLTFLWDLSPYGHLPGWIIVIVLCVRTR